MTPLESVDLAAARRVRNPRPQYRLKNGTRVPSVTSVLAVRGKDYLVRWAGKLGLQGIDPQKYVEEAAGAGTLVHRAIEATLKGEPFPRDYAELFSEAEREMARTAWRAFIGWRARHELEPLLMEHSLVSERFRVGGTLDLYARVDGRRELLDFKTSARVNDDHVLQLAAYRALLEEHGHQVDAVRVVLVPREPLVLDGEGERVVEDTTHQLNVFIAARALYDAQRVMEQAQRRNREVARAERNRVKQDIEIDWQRLKGE